MKRSLLFTVLFSLLLSFGYAAVSPALAAGSPPDPGAEALQLLEGTGLGGSTPAEAGAQLPVTIGKLVRAVLGLLGIILIVLMIYAGFLWMTARGESGQVDKAKQTITRAVIGAVIVFSAYAITGFVVNAVIEAGKTTAGG